jgi:AcrR family transcriptional regulator
MGEIISDNQTLDERQRIKRDPEGVRRNILVVAMEEFAKNGLSGARIDEIANKTCTSKRMIYYYYGDKEGLYRKVLEESYRKVREGEAGLELDDLDPVVALRKLALFTFNHHRQNPDFIRIVMIENIHHGAYISQAAVLRDLNRPAIDRLVAILRRGVEEGVFRAGIDPLELHWQISALSFFNVSNQATFSHLFGGRLWENGGEARLASHIADMILRFALRAELIANFTDENCATGGLDDRY